MTANDKRMPPTRTARKPSVASQAREDPPDLSFLYFLSAGSGTFRVVVLPNIRGEIRGLG